MGHNLHILLDIDGVVLDWKNGVEKFMHENHPHLIDPNSINELAYDLSTRYGMTREEANQLVWDFHTSPDFSQIQPMPGAVEAIPELRKLGKIIAITACSSQPDIVASRKKNLQNIFGDAFSEVHCTDTFSEKRKYLAMYPPGVWVEDHYRNAVMGLAYGHTCFLVESDHSPEETLNVIKIPDLRALVDWITREQ
jgi:FMN phosphatase YigB (HAD superfamily)